MVGYLPEESLKEIVSNQDKLLDIASKSGEYAVALYKRLTSELGYSHENVKNIIYSIPTSSIAYEFTKRFYEILDLNVENIATKFNAYDLVKVKNDKDEVDYEKISGILKQNKKFSDITLQDELKAGDKKVNFGSIIGNPPYQENNSLRNRDDSIYNLFMEMGYSISDICIFVTPARFLNNVGSTPTIWNNKMLNDQHFKVERYAAKSTDIFEHVDIKGGIAITSRNQNLIYEPIEMFVSSNILREIYQKVKIKSNNFEDNISSLMYVQNKFNLKNVFDDFPKLENIIKKEKRITSSAFKDYNELFKEHRFNNSVQIYGRVSNKRTYMWMHKKYLEPHDNFEFYKVFVPAANGSGALGEVLSTPVIGYPVIGYTQTFISLGKFKTEQEAEALLKYIKSKFARLMLGLKKTTQNNKTKETWSKIPMQDFTEKSDIDWTKSIVEIDEQLFDKYNLSIEERQHIKKSIKDM
ncbi:Eco57I restriction-modification methylase domain-containing protein [Mesomycoplasma ovipneumoniae]|nr:Eco57I restriction-modification methylase domain-containing protein [Mesomycoplasma ovipneumoniae]MDW2928014.1 Eco57I restriction-modification methylase domain-containing protein [Mesomycoplasma ovipneumoniae]MDW2934368.1 Eco57I restriction-modification methylase domain-containing protein [Mesomycoplasma ovipneumoniae]